MSEALSDPALRLAELWQREFPICTHPFAKIGSMLDLTGGETITMLEALKARQVLARVGAAVRPNTVGASTLAALAVPQDRLESVAEIVSSQSAVNHNYERDHQINLWFVVAAPGRDDVSATLGRISDRTGLEVLDLPLERSYHIDLGFRLSGLRRDGQSGRAANQCSRQLAPKDRQLIAALEPGLQLVPRPYHALSRQLGWTEGQVMSRLASLIENGVISRFGCILRHRKIGYTANAMAVWNVPDDQVDDIAARMAKIDAVTLCYRRTRRPPDWPYNLFAMIHGQEEAEVRREIGAAELATGLQAYPAAVLFSKRCFKQSGARYFPQLKGAA